VIISYVFHPLLMTTLLFFTLFLIDSSVVLPYINAMNQLLLIIFLVTFVIPLISISFLRITHTISSFKLEERRERILPFAFITIFYGVACWMFLTRINLGPMINTMLLSITATILILTFITMFWKISAHSAGIGGLIGFLTVLYVEEPTALVRMALVVSVLVAGVVMASRLKLNSHSPSQVYAGLILGFGLCFSSVYFFV